MTANELAQAWDISLTRVWKLLHQGRLDPYVKKVEVNGRTFYEIDPEAEKHRPVDRRRKVK
jgi:hypothetical protein